MTDESTRLMAAFRALGEAVEGERPLGAVLITTEPPSRLWLYLPADADTFERVTLLDEIHQALRVLLNQVDLARREALTAGRKSGTDGP